MYRDGQKVPTRLALFYCLGYKNRTIRGQSLKQPHPDQRNIGIHALEKRVSNFVVVRHWEDWFATTRRRCIQPAKCVLCAFKHDSVLSLVTTWLYSLACSPKKPFLDPPVAVVVVVVYHFQACRDSFAARPLNTAPTKQSEFPIIPDTAERISG